MHLPHVRERYKAGEVCTYPMYGSTMRLVMRTMMRSTELGARTKVFFRVMSQPVRWARMVTVEREREGSRGTGEQLAERGLRLTGQPQCDITGPPLQADWAVIEWLFWKFPEPSPSWL